MPMITYIDKRFSAGSRIVIDQANEILDDYAAQGYDLTLRQLFYQFVSRALLPNTQRSYKRLGSIISDARLAGEVDWARLVDRTRNLRDLPTWADPSSIVASCADQFRIDRWAGQPCRIEVWIEKDALIGVIAGVCNRLRVPYFSCRGYTSQSEMWSAGRRLRDHELEGQAPVILHLGDHDPSGIDMTRDIRDRLEQFCSPEIEVDRLALNMDQVEQYDPPPNPAKITDSRAESYIRRFGGDSWELDALEPAVLSQLIEDAIEARVDAAAMAAATDVEEGHRATLAAVSRDWDSIVEDLEL